MTTVANRFNSVATSTLLDTDCHRHLLSKMRYDHGINYCYQLIYIRCVRVVENLLLNFTKGLLIINFHLQQRVALLYNYYDFRITSRNIFRCLRLIESIYIKVKLSSIFVIYLRDTVPTPALSNKKFFPSFNMNKKWTWYSKELSNGV